MISSAYLHLNFISHLQFKKAISSAVPASEYNRKYETYAMYLSLKLVCCLWESLLDLIVVAVTCRIYAKFGSYNLCRFNCKLGATGKESYTSL